MKAYESTKVPIGRSIEAIRKLLRDHGAEMIQIGETPGNKLAIQFTRSELAIRLEVPYESTEEARLWRVLYWYTKTRLEGVDSGLEDFEQAFLAHIIDPRSNLTLIDLLRPHLEAGVFDIGAQGLPALTSGRST